MSDCTVVQRVNGDGLSLSDVHSGQRSVDVVYVDSEASGDRRIACSAGYRAVVEKGEDCKGNGQIRCDRNDYD